MSPEELRNVESISDPEADRDEADSTRCEGVTVVNEILPTAARATVTDQATTEPTALEVVIATISVTAADRDITPVIEPILAEIGRLEPLEQERHLKLLQQQIGKGQASIATLRR